MGKLVPLQHGRTNGELLHRAARNPSLPLESELDEESEAVQLAAVAVAEAARHIARTHAPCGRLPAAVLGHSLGGKIALRYLRIAAAAAAAAGDGDGAGGRDRGRGRSVPLQTWSLDSVPAALGPNDDPHDVQRVIDAIRSLPRTFASREALRAALAAHETANKFPKDLVDWLGSNLVPAGLCTS